MAALCTAHLTCWAEGAAQNAEPSEMALVPSGSFLMGSPDGSRYAAVEKPQHSVYLEAFLIDKNEVTNRMFAEFLNAVKSQDGFDATRRSWIVIREDLAPDDKRELWPAEIVPEKGRFLASKGFEQFPVISVSWHAAEAYCKWAGKRLPTEAEWEKAARGGLTEKDYPWGNELPTEGIIFKRVWTNNFFPAPVEVIRNYFPNGYGIFDMAGNAAEWCSDWYDPNYYRQSPEKNPTGPSTGRSKVLRGGSWAGNADSVRVANRNFSLPNRLNSGVGFRCAKDNK